MREEWRFSQRGGYRERPKDGVALFEHEYAVDGPAPDLADPAGPRAPVPPELPPAAAARRDPAHAARALDPDRGHPGLHVRGHARSSPRPDFGFWTPANRLALVDWKTGSPHPEETAVQLGGYALYARDILEVAPEQVDLIEVNLRAGEVTAHPWDEARLEAIRDRLRLSIRGMKAWLRDPDANVAVLEDFERTEDLRLCRWCNFKSVCRPELLAEAAPVAEGAQPAGVEPGAAAAGG